MFKYYQLANRMMSSKDKQHQTEEIVIEKNIVIDASPEVVFRAITDQAELTNWVPDQAIVEAKLGGKVKFGFYKDKEHKQGELKSHEGTIVEFIPNKKV